MVLQVLHCPYCQGTDIVRHGMTRQGKQRYRCRAVPRGAGAHFFWNIAYAGQSPDVKQQIVDMAMNASGIRDTARVLHVSPTTVMKELKKRHLTLKQVNQAVLQHLHPEHVEVEICRADELAQRRGLTSELDEMWSYVGKKAEPRWLWHAIDHHSGTVLAYVFGRRKDAVFLQLQALLEPFGITPLLHRWVGRLRAAYRPRAASRGQGEHAENREQTHQSADPDQAARPSHHLLFQNDDHARSGDWPLHQSLRVWSRSLTGDQHL